MRKIITALVTHGISACLGALLCFGYFILPNVVPQNLGLRENGRGWFVFYPAIIARCNCVEMSVQLGDRLVPQNQFEITEPHKIAEVKKWILDNKFADQINYSPIWPRDVGRSVISIYYITLHDSTWTDPEGELNSRIITIPLEPLPMGITELEWNGKIAELRKLLETK